MRIGIIEIAVKTCIHMVRSELPNTKPISFGSGVLVIYKERYFICTVSHFTDYPNQTSGIVTGRVIKNGMEEVYYLGDFSYVTKISFEELPDAEDLTFCIDNPNRSGEKLDVAVREISKLDNIIQKQKEFYFDDIGEIIVNEGGKAMVIVDDDYIVNCKESCTFFGRVIADNEENKLELEEKLYHGLPIKSIGDEFIEMDLCEPIHDHKRFKGCSGAPIIDTKGRLIGLVTHGEKDTSKSSIYGIRFDKVKRYIDLWYFS
jgi:hypothetical protein